MKKITLLSLTALMWLMGTNAWALDQKDGVYQIGTAEDLAAFAKIVNDGETYANAVLTADIDYTNNGIQIGSNGFYGVFDGQGHKVTVAFEGADVKGVNAALFFKVMGIVKNLWVSGTITSPLDNVASIAVNLYGWVDHCYSDATISCTKTGSSSCGGIVGQCYSGASISNSFFGGKFTSETATNFSGIMGWSDGTNTVAHCLVVAECEGTACNGEGGDGYMFARNCSRVDNNYCLYNAEANLKANAFKSDRQFVGNFTTTAAELADGTIAYKLGWGQELGVDAMPSPFSTKTVYPVGDCSSPTEYTNDAAQSAHVYSGYKCSVCGAYTPDFMTPVDGVYQIGTPEQLCWFALYVNARHSDVDAVLTADIDMSGVTDYPMIGTHGEQTAFYSMYRGTFDGQGHKISNLAVDMPNFWNIGLFGSVAAPAVVKNIFTDETCSFSGKKNIGGIMGQTFGVGGGGIVTLLNLGSAAKMKSNGASDAGVAGIVGKCAGGVKGVITNCWFEGEITGTSLGYISGWCGSNQFTLNNCWSISQSEGVNGLARAGSSTAIKMNNCFTLKGTMGTAITEEDVTSGALCYGLNKGVEKPAWHQTLGTDAKPSLQGNDLVYKVGALFCDGADDMVSYSNTNTGLSYGDHTFGDDGICTACGMGLVDGTYQISKAAHMQWFASFVNKGNTTANAVLTADINGYSGTMIGTASVYYAGTFDGQYHKITYTTEPTEAVWGLFRTLTGTVRNLSVAGTITTSQKQVGSIVGFLYGGSVENCISTVDITTSFSGDAGTGGIIASSVQTGSVIKDCVFAGSIKGESANSCAGIAGWTGGSSSLTLTNCLAIGELSVNSKNCDVIARNPGRVTRTNCYYLTAFGNVSADLTKISAEQLASGEVCYLLNGDQSSIQWTQAIATDAIPTPFPTGKKVFAVPGGGYRCDGKLLGETTYSNTDPQIGIPAHSFSNAFCQVCGKPDPDYIKPNAQGFYELGSATDLNWFACMVNDGNNTINAMLTSDINNYAETMIGTADIYYDGIFDGQYHTINFTTEPTEPRWSLFRTMSGTVKNLHATGTITTSQNQVGGIVGFLYGGTIENCLCTVDITSTFNGDAGTGGIIATSMLPNGVIKDCIFAGSIKSETAYSFGGIAGWVTAAGDLTLTNCLTIGEITANDKDGNVIARNPDRVKRTNCYYLNAFSAIPEDIKQITAEQLASGEVCYLLNGEQTSIQWTQTLTKDAYPKPFPNGQQVFVGASGFRCDGTPLGDIVYSNTSIPVTIPTHTFVDGICQVCGQTDDSFVLAGEDGVYTLGTAGQLIWFATKVNNGETTLNARLSADINMQGLGDKFPMIGTSNNPYAGTFDGQFHTISNLNLAREANDVALFSYVKDGCTIQNLIVDATCSSSGANYTAGIVSRCKGDHTPL
ncbi:MAG: hypothetical protein K5945_11120, partial [Bacteroidaceae bacterium]|nr:hypothetical protein [Bacteroidaceae bacterium]